MVQFYVLKTTLFKIYSSHNVWDSSFNLSTLVTIISNLYSLCCNLLNVCQYRTNMDAFGKLQNSK